MKWFSVEWSTREFSEQKIVELIFCASDQIRDQLSNITKVPSVNLMIHTITEYDIPTIKGGFC
jgi:hypothetical protein